MKKMVALAIVMAGVVTYGLQRTPSPALKNSPFNEQRADTDLRNLVGFGPRPAGSEAITKARNYIVSELTKAGLKPQRCGSPLSRSNTERSEGIQPRGHDRR